MTSAAKKFACAAAVCALASSVSLHAQLGVGTWIKQSKPGELTAGLTMTVEACCGSGYRIVYRLAGRSEPLMSLESALDGKDVPVLLADGKASGETMAITRVDDHHLSTVLKMDGKPFGTSKAALSLDSKTLTVENIITVAAQGQTVGKQTEVWVHK